MIQKTKKIITTPDTGTGSTTPRNYIDQNRAAMFDWLVFMTGFLLGFIFPNLSAFMAYHGFSYWILGALVLYLVGAWLKHRPLYSRLIREGQSPRQMPFLIFLLIGHWLIIFTAIIFAEPAIIKILKLNIPENDPASGVATLVSILVSAFITWLVYHHKIKIKHPEKNKDNYLFYRELIADFFLCASVSIFTFAFWQNGVMSIFDGRGLNSFAGVFASLIMLALAYILFYLPLRYLYLVEDHSNRQTWRRILFIFGLMLVRALFVMLHL